MSSLPLDKFLYTKTPESWLVWALDHPEILLIDHANCEKKAAATALHLIHRYVEHAELLDKMSKLAREELLHFEKVLQLMQARGIAYQQITPARYASALCEEVRQEEPYRLIDRLIIGAFIEARSCERFHALIGRVDETLSRFYQSLYAAEKRHFHDYLILAQTYSSVDLSERIDYFAIKEAALITAVDTEFRFHSGVPG